MLLRSFFRLAIAPVLLACACLAQTAVDLDGTRLDPIKTNPGKVVVLIFVRRDCPISGRYAPTIQRISEEHKSDTRFYLVFPDKADSADQIRSYLRDFRYSLPALRDPAHVLVKQAHAQITPDAAVFGRKGQLVYHGRIDDLFVAFGRARSSATTHELEDAIEAAAAGRSPAKTEVAGVGCYISDLE
jgi:AhpC/TSA family